MVIYFFYSIPLFIVEFSNIDFLFQNVADYNCKRSVRIFKVFLFYLSLFTFFVWNITFQIWIINNNNNGFTTSLKGIPIDHQNDNNSTDETENFAYREICSALWSTEKTVELFHLRLINNFMNRRNFICSFIQNNSCRCFENSN